MKKIRNTTAFPEPMGRRGNGVPGAVFLLLFFLAQAPLAAIENLTMTEVRPSTGEVEITNLSDDPVTVSSPLPFCYRFVYSPSIPAGTVFEARESKVFNLSLNSNDSDVWLYRDSNFGSSNSILTGMKFGPQSSVGRTSVAVQAGIWPSTDAFVPTPSADQSLQLRGRDPTDPESWAAGEPRPGEFFGVGFGVVQVTPGEGMLEIEFSSALGTGWHAIETRTSLVDSSDWAPIEVDVEEIDAGVFRVRVPMQDPEKQFYRIVQEF